MSNSILNELFIVYIEDDPASRTVMSLILEKAMGIKSYIIFEDSDKVLEKFGKLDIVPDIVLLDIHMTPFDGFEVLQMLRAAPNYRSATIIALTASVMNEEVNDLRTAGFDGAISKPLDHRSFPELLKRIANGESVWSIS
jgi:CheY-like chemotaxis protein